MDTVRGNTHTALGLAIFFPTVLLETAFDDDAAALL